MRYYISARDSDKHIAYFVDNEKRHGMFGDGYKDSFRFNGRTPAEKKIAELAPFYPDYTDWRASIHTGH